jgi:hypothetical protein
MVPHNKMTEIVTKKRIDPKTMKELKVEPEAKILHGIEPKDDDDDKKKLLTGARPPLSKSAVSRFRSKSKVTK